MLSTIHKNCCDSNYQKNNQLVTPGLEKVLQDSFSCFAHFETIRSKRDKKNKSDERVTCETALETLYRGYLTLSTQLIKSIHLKWVSQTVRKITVKILGVKGFWLQGVLWWI